MVWMAFYDTDSPDRGDSRMIFYGYHPTKVDDLVVEMETQAVDLVEIVHGERD